MLSIIELLKKYKISFYRRKDNSSHAYAEGGGVIAWFLDDLWDEDNIIEILMYVRELLSGGTHNSEKDYIGLDASSARIKGSIVEFGELGSGVLETASLEEFEQILDAWLKFKQN